MECKCTFVQKMNGDGCAVCNPERAKDLMPTIIEKLGITPGPWVIERNETRFGGIEITGDGIYTPATLYIDKEDAKLIASAPEMLEALIECAEALDYIGQYDTPIGLPEKVIGAIEKATGKTWEEVKALMGE